MVRTWGTQSKLQISVEMKPVQKMLMSTTSSNFEKYRFFCTFDYKFNKEYELQH